MHTEHQIPMQKINIPATISDIEMWDTWCVIKIFYIIVKFLHKPPSPRFNVAFSCQTIVANEVRQITTSNYGLTTLKRGWGGLTFQFESVVPPNLSLIV